MESQQQEEEEHPQEEEEAVPKEGDQTSTGKSKMSAKKIIVQLDVVRRST